MVMDNHICPYGLKSKYLLEKHGYEVEDNHLTTREETDDFKKQHNVKTTPQTFIDGNNIGGHDDLVKFFNEEKSSALKKYQPIIAIFTMTFLMAVMITWFAYENLYFSDIVKTFVATSMCVLAILKLRDLESFSSMFLNYDVLAQRFVPYAYIYPFAEAVAGLMMLGRVFIPLAVIIALFIGSIGAWSVFKAVYLDKRELKCACVGGNSDVPLGAISLTENVMMVLIAIWMLFSLT